MSPLPKIDKTKCNICGICVQICPMEVFEKSEKEIIVKDGKCIGCKACELQCEKTALIIKDD